MADETTGALRTAVIKIFDCCPGQIQERGVPGCWVGLLYGPSCRSKYWCFEWETQLRKQYVQPLHIHTTCSIQAGHHISGLHGPRTSVLCGSQGSFLACQQPIPPKMFNLFFWFRCLNLSTSLALGLAWGTRQSLFSKRGVLGMLFGRCPLPRAGPHF